MNAFPPLRHALGIQLRVIGALLMREVLTRYGRHNIGFAWLFVEPMIFTMGIAALWTLSKGTHGSPLPIIPFAITGYSSVLLWRNAANRCIRAIEPNLSLLFHRNVAMIDIYAARLLLEIAGATTSLVVLLGLFIFVGEANIPSDPAVMVSAWFLLCWFAVGLGLTVGVLAERSEGFERIWHTMTYLMFPLSGALFMVDWLPAQMQALVLWIPMVHAVEMLRGGYYGSMVTTHYSIEYIVTVNAVLLFVGLFLVDRFKHSVASE